MQEIPIVADIDASRLTWTVVPTMCKRLKVACVKCPDHGIYVFLQSATRYQPDVFSPTDCIPTAAAIRTFLMCTSAGRQYLQLPSTVLCGSAAMVEQHVRSLRMWVISRMQDLVKWDDGRTYLRTMDIRVRLVVAPDKSRPGFVCWIEEMVGPRPPRGVTGKEEFWPKTYFDDDRQLSLINACRFGSGSDVDAWIKRMRAVYSRSKPKAPTS